MKIEFLKVSFEQTGSTKYIRTTDKDSVVIVDSGSEVKMEKFGAPYPTGNGEWLQPSTKGEFEDKLRLATL